MAIKMIGVICPGEEVKEYPKNDDDKCQAYTGGWLKAYEPYVLILQMNRPTNNYITRLAINGRVRYFSKTEFVYHWTLNPTDQVKCRPVSTPGHPSTTTNYSEAKIG